MTERDTPKMTHDEIIDTLKGLVFGTFDRTTAKEREALDMAISALKGGWIPVTERLPEAYKTVIRSNRTISWNGSVNEYVDIGTIDPTDHFVVAWQPLPEPYKKGE